MRKALARTVEARGRVAASFYLAGLSTLTRPAWTVFNIQLDPGPASTRA